MRTLSLKLQAASTLRMPNAWATLVAAVVMLLLPPRDLPAQQLAKLQTAAHARTVTVEPTDSVHATEHKSHWVTGAALGAAVGAGFVVARLLQPGRSFHFDDITIGVILSGALLGALIAALVPG